MNGRTSRGGPNSHIDRIIDLGFEWDNFIFGRKKIREEGLRNRLENNCQQLVKPWHWKEKPSEASKASRNSKHILKTSQNITFNDECFSMFRWWNHLNIRIFHGRYGSSMLFQSKDFPIENPSQSSAWDIPELGMRRKTRAKLSAAKCRILILRCFLGKKKNTKSGGEICDQVTSRYFKYHLATHNR